MPNKFYNETATLSVYVANLEEYVNGNLVGNWISLPIEKNNFEEFLKTIGNPEEIAIHDYESGSGFNSLEIEYYSSISYLNKLARKLEEIKNKGLVNEFNALYETLEDFEETVECLESENYVFYDNMTMEEVAQEHIKEYYDIPKGLENYIDYRLYARDMDIEGYYHTTTYGTIEIL